MKKLLMIVMVLALAGCASSVRVKDGGRDYTGDGSYNRNICAVSVNSDFVGEFSYASEQCKVHVINVVKSDG